MFCTSAALSVPQGEAAARHPTGRATWNLSEEANAPRCHSREGGKVDSRFKCNTWQAREKVDFRSGVGMTQPGKVLKTKPNFSTLLGNPAQIAGFPHSHRACDGSYFQRSKALRR